MPDTTTESVLEVDELPIPLGNRVLVRRDMAAVKTEGGILLPEKSKVVPKRGLVLDVGPGRILENGDRAPMEIVKGDRVWFSSYAGTDLDGTEDEGGFVIMRDEDVLARDPREGEL